MVIFEVPFTADRPSVLKVELLLMAWNTAPESIETGLFPIETGASMFEFLNQSHFVETFITIHSSV